MSGRGHAGDKALIAQGGRGGRGNAAFKSSQNKAPVIAEDGEAGIGMWLDLELKLIADVGIIGMPSAGTPRALQNVLCKPPVHLFSILFPAWCGACIRAGMIDTYSTMIPVCFEQHALCEAHHHCLLYTSDAADE